MSTPHPPRRFASPPSLACGGWEATPEARQSRFLGVPGLLHVLRGVRGAGLLHNAKGLS